MNKEVIIKAVIKDVSFGHVFVDGEKHYIRGFFQETTHDLAKKNSEIYDELSRYLDVDGVNYAYFIHYFIRFSLGLFKHCGLETIMSYINILDKYVDKDLVLEVEDCYKDVFVECARIICKKKKVNLTIVSSTSSVKSKIYDNHFIAMTNSMMIVRYGIGLVRRLLRRNNSAQKGILFLANIRFCNADVKKNKMFGGIVSNMYDSSYKIIRYNKLTRIEQLKDFLKNYMWKKESFIGDYYTVGHFFRCLKTFRKVKKAWNVTPQKKLRSLCVYKGYDFYHLLEPRINAIFDYLCYSVVDIAEIVKTIKKNEICSSLVVVDHEENMYAKAFMMEPKKKTYALSHELIYPGCVHTHIKSHHKRPLPDLKFVWGEYSKQVLMKHCDYPESIIKITGSPKFDKLISKEYNTEHIIKKYSLSNKEKILYLPSILSDERLETIEKIIQLNPQYEIIIKPHPNFDDNNITAYFNNKPSNLKIAKKSDDTYELMHVSKYILHEASTSGFEAMLMGKIVFSMNISGKSYSGIPYENNQINCISPKDFTDKLKVINEIDVRKNIKSFIEKMHKNVKGNASEIVAMYCLAGRI